MERSDEFDLLTAALLGAMVGAGVALMVSRGGGRKGFRRQLTRAALAKAAKTGAKRARTMGRRGARWATDTGEELLDRVPVDQARKQVTDYFDTVREAIDETVSSELDDLRKSIRRRRKKLGV